jgi:hypothetical protein
MVHANQAQKPEHINRNRRTRHGCVLVYEPMPKT